MATLTLTEMTPKAVGGRTAKPNEFLAPVKLDDGSDGFVINTLDDGKARLVTPGKDEKLVTILTQLRAAADKIGRSVTVEYVGGDRKTATAFKFQIRSKITRTRKPKAAEGTEGTEAAPAEAAPVAPAAPAKGKGKAAAA